MPPVRRTDMRSAVIMMAHLNLVANEIRDSIGRNYDLGVLQSDPKAGKAERYWALAFDFNQAITQSEPNKWTVEDAKGH